MDSLEIFKQLNMTYQEQVDYLLQKYGKAQYDYFRNDNCSSVNPKASRSQEGLTCHHIDEDKAIQLGAIKYAKQNPYEYQKAERLVYCNHLEHLILHINITLEPRHVNSNLKEFHGIGGVFNIAASLNDFYDGYESQKEYLRIAFGLVENNFNDYIEILRYFIKKLIKLKHPALKKIGNRLSLINRLSFGFNVEERRVYDKLIPPDIEDLMPEEELVELINSANQRIEESQITLGKLYMKGEHIAFDKKLSFKYFEMAAKQKSLYGNWMIGEFYFHGFGVKKDYSRALEYYKFVAEKGLDFAQYKVATCYLNGQGVEKDINEAIKWLIESANQGYLKAQIELGTMYYDRLRRFKKNVLEAIKWYELAAQQKDPKAYLELGVIYLNGVGISQDLSKSEAYFEEAQAYGNQLASEYLKKHF